MFKVRLGTTVTFVAGDDATSTPVVVDEDVTVGKRDGANLTKATATIGNLQAGDELEIAGATAGTTAGGLTFRYDAGTGVLTLTGAASAAAYQAALDSVEFTSTAVTPAQTPSRSVTFAAQDAAGNTGTSAADTVTVQDTDQTPVVTATGGTTAAFVAGDNTASTPVVVDKSVTVGKADGTNLTKATATLGNAQPGDALEINGTASGTTAGGLTYSYDAGVLTLQGSASATAYQAALDSVEFTSTAVTPPATPSRTVTFAATDGTRTGTSATDIVTVTDTDQTPVVTATGGTTAAFVAGDNTASTPVVVDKDVTVGKADGASLTKATATIGNLQAGDELEIAGATAGTTAGGLSYGFADGVLTLTGSASAAAYQAALDRVQFTSTAVTPAQTPSRSVTFAAQDAAGNTGTSTADTVTVQDTDQTPTVTASGSTAAFTAGDNAPSTPVVVDKDVTVGKADGVNLTKATATLGNAQPGDELEIAGATAGTTAGGLTYSYDAGVLTLTGSASAAAYQAALDSVEFTSTAVTPPAAPSRTVTFAATDGTKTGTSTADTVTVQDTDQTPTVTASGSTAAFTAGDNAPSTPVTVDEDVTVGKADGTNLTKATATLGNAQAGDALEIAGTASGTTAGGLTFGYDAGTGVLTLTGSASAATYQAALDGVEFTSTAVTPPAAPSRTVTFAATDGTRTGISAADSVTVQDTDQTPVVTATGGTTAAYTGGGRPVVVDAGAKVSDADDATLSSATVTITDAQAGDVLGFTDDGSEGDIAGSYASGVLTLSSAGSTATVAQFQAALDAVTFSTASATPDTAPRLISFAAGDGRKTGTAGQTDTVTVARQPAAPPPPAPTPDAVSLSSQVTYDHGVFTITGTASSPAGIGSVEISAVVDGARQDLGAATVNADGTFSFQDAVSGQQSFFVATLTDGAGGQATNADPGFNLQGGLGPRGTSGLQNSFDAAEQVSSTLFRANGTSTVDVEAPGQTVKLQPYAVALDHHQGGTTFVFDPGDGIDVVHGFVARGANHDVVSLKGADFDDSVADVLRNTGDVGGSAFVTDPVTGDAIRLAGVSTAELKRGDVVFHA